MRRRISLASIALAGCGAVGSSEPAKVGAAAAHGPTTYTVTEAEPGVLDVSIRVPAGGFGRTTIEDDALGFVSGLTVTDASGAAAKVEVEGGEVVAAACDEACTLRYRFDLGRAASAWKNPQFAGKVGDALFAPPTTWLLFPKHPTDEPFELEVRADGFVTGLGRRPSGRYGARLSDLAEAPYAAFGVHRVHTIDVGDGEITLAIAGLEPKVGDARLEQWTRDAAEDVRAYYGRYAAAPALVLAIVEAGDDIGSGTALGNGGASILVRVGDEVSDSALAEDWILTHEMVHLSMPGLHQKQNWMEEGLATYLEPVLRARRGRLSEEAVWREWYGSMAYGLPLAGDGALDGTRSWGRLYWGGATFWLLADLAIRRETHDTRSIRECLAAVQAAGGTIAVRWGIDHFVDTCDAGVGAPVVRGLYEKYGKNAGTVDLDALFGALGVHRVKGGVAFDPNAPEADLRAAIAAPADTTAAGAVRAR
jgi:hypothetical protein